MVEFSNFPLTLIRIAQDVNFFNNAIENKYYSKCS